MFYLKNFGFGGATLVLAIWITLKLFKLYIHFIARQVRGIPTEAQSNARKSGAARTSPVARLNAEEVILENSSQLNPSTDGTPLSSVAKRRNRARGRGRGTRSS